MVFVVSNGLHDADQRSAVELLRELLFDRFAYERRRCGAGRGETLACGIVEMRKNDRGVGAPERSPLRFITVGAAVPARVVLKETSKHALTERAREHSRVELVVWHEHDGRFGQFRLPSRVPTV